MSARDVISKAVEGWFLNPNDEYVDGASARILSALDKAGYAVVPKEPTEGMLRAYYQCMVGNAPDCAHEPRQVSDAQPEGQYTLARNAHSSEGNTMSDLVEKVHGAVSNYCTHSGPPIQGRPCGMCDAITRAAIAAVAEWMMSKDGDMFYSGQRLQKQLERPK